MLVVDEEETGTFQCLAPGWFDVTRDSAYEVGLPYIIRVHYRDVGFLQYDSDEDEDEDKEKDNYIIAGKEFKIRSPGRNNKEDKIKVNKGLMRYLGLVPGHTHDWRGPVLAYGIEEFFPDSTPKRTVDLVSDNAPHIANFVRSLTDAIEMISCVRLNCNSDVTVDGRPRYEVILLPSFHAIFAQNTTPVSARIELPIKLGGSPAASTSGSQSRH
jgi:hypothetical protein